jgi:hypothetical protein
VLLLGGNNGLQQLERHRLPLFIYRTSLANDFYILFDALQAI